jgi:hypothetical protein
LGLGPAVEAVNAEGDQEDEDGEAAHWGNSDFGIRISELGRQV